MIARKIKISIYSGNLHLIFADDLEKDYKFINKRYPKLKLNKKGLQFYAITSVINNNYIVVFNMNSFPKKSTNVEIVETIAHESIHLFSFLSKRIGLYPDVDNDEAQAYLTGWFAGTMYKAYLEFKEDERQKIEKTD